MRHRRKCENNIDMYLTGVGDGVAAMLRTGVRIAVGARDFSPLQNLETDSRVHPASYSMGTAVFSGDKAVEA
jgi:hypothetical protein